MRSRCWGGAVSGTSVRGARARSWWRKVEQEFASPVGEGANPLPDGRAGWTAVGRPSLGFQRLHQATPAQASDEIERDSQLQQVSSIESMGVHKVRQQTVCAATDLAPHALNPDAVVAVGCAGPPLVGAPTNQRIGCSAFRVWAAVWQGKAATWKGDCFGVLLDGIGKVLYNDHVVGTPPLVVKLASSKSRREVSSFLPQWCVIIPPLACSVKSGRSQYPFLAAQSVWPYTLCFPLPVQAQSFYLAGIGLISTKESGL